MEAGFTVTYQQYIGSAAWAALRQQALERDGHRCRMCNAKSVDVRLEVHHRYYPEVRDDWERDCLDAVTSVCVPCHDVWTDIQYRNKYSLLTFAATEHIRAIPAAAITVEVPVTIAPTAHQRSTAIHETPEIAVAVTVHVAVKPHRRLI